MIPIHSMNIIQIDVTNACINQCSNCTRFCGHHQSTFFMEPDFYRKAVLSLRDFPGMVGMIGGEPLLHPQFETLCQILRETIPDKKRRGLWSTVPGALGEKYGALIKETFGELFLNDHSIDNIKHQPILVRADNVVKEPEAMWDYINNCWVQRLWSATITPKGAFFCEVAGSFDMLFNGPGGWPVEENWWRREPDQFTEQKERWCAGCGCAIPLDRRPSAENMDDVCPSNLSALEQINSPKIRRGKYKLYQNGLSKNWRPDSNWYMQEVENQREYRANIASRLDAAPEHEACAPESSGGAHSSAACFDHKD